jgi:hypothetical protein
MSMYAESIRKYGRMHVDCSVIDISTCRVILKQIFFYTFVISQKISRRSRLQIYLKSSQRQKTRVTQFLERIKEN